MTCKVKDTAVSDLQDFLRLHGQQAPGLGVNDLNVELKPFDTCCMRQRASESGIVEQNCLDLFGFHFCLIILHG